MKSVFEKENFEELNSRLQKLSPRSVSLWGTMSVSQMLHHLNLTMETPLGKIQSKSNPFFLMRMFKSVLYNDKPFRHGSPTPKDFKIAMNSTFNFEKEKQNVSENLKAIFDKGLKGDYKPHVFFGPMTSEQWGMHFYKHTDHHLRQFDV